MGQGHRRQGRRRHLGNEITAKSGASRQLGQSLGVAIVGSVLAASLRGSLHGGFLEAAHAGWWIMAGCGYAVLVLGVIATTQWAKATAIKAGADI